MDKRTALPLAGFSVAAVLLTSLSSFMLFTGFFAKTTGVGRDEITYLGTLAFFSGMPFAKVMGRLLKFYKNSVIGTALVISLVTTTIFLMPYTNSLLVLLLFRFVQGSSMILMEVFSVNYSYIFDERKRVMATVFSISGVPVGVALGSSLSFLASMNPYEAYLYMGLLSALLMVPFLVFLGGRRSDFRPLKLEEPGTTYKKPVTWVLGFLWMSITGFNLLMASLYPMFLAQYDPKAITLALYVFGFGGFTITILGSVIAYYLYPKLGPRSLGLVGTLGFGLSIPGFLLLFVRPTGVLLILAVLLGRFEAFGITTIYLSPKLVYPEGMVGKGTWEFSFLGSLGHIIAPMTVIPIAYQFGFGTAFSLLLIFPVYGMFASLLLPRAFKLAKRRQSLAAASRDKSQREPENVKQPEHRQ
ncbi:MAG: MFS transporter [TACK group archaeon]|nr:MFS transporter [TACK group archaeon]